MVVMDRNLFSPLGVFLLVIFGIESLVCLLANGFVLAMSGHTWLQRKKMLLCDFLLTTLSLSRFLLQSVSMTSQFMYFTSPETYTDSKEQIFILSWIYLSAASHLCTTCLYYCVKVTNFTLPLFSWLKLRIGVLVPRFLGVALLVFIICSIHPVMRYFEEGKCHNFTKNLPENTSRSGKNYVLFLNTPQIYFTAISFSICFTASVILLLSLWRHTRNLKKGGFNTKDFSTQAHLRVMKSLLLSLSFGILHFVAMILTLMDVFKYGKVTRLISDLLLCLYPSADTIILIFANPKLRKTCIRLLNLRRSAS